MNSTLSTYPAVTPDSSTGCPRLSPSPHAKWAYNGYPRSSPPCDSQTVPAMAMIRPAVTMMPTSTSSRRFIYVGAGFSNEIASENHGGQRVQHQYGHGSYDHRARRASPDAFGARLREVPLEGAEERDRRPEQKRLQQAVENLERCEGESQALGEIRE